jgi:hypothetical protein
MDELSAITQETVASMPGTMPGSMPSLASITMPSMKDMGLA